MTDAFKRYDETADEAFYTVPRKVVHIDEGAIEAATQLYRELVPDGGRVLDLMSSWRSHLPTDRTYAEVVGLGMNAAEMADNPQLTEFVVHNLNREPRLPFEDGRFDAAVCTVSVQYLTQPIEVFRDLARVLGPGGVAVFTFSNRCFPTKAVMAWQAATDEQHVGLVGHYFEASGVWERVAWADRSPRRAQYGMADPLYGVWAYVKHGPQTVDSRPL